LQRSLSEAKRSHETELASLEQQHAQALQQAADTNEAVLVQIKETHQKQMSNLTADAEYRCYRLEQEIKKEEADRAARDLEKEKELTQRLDAARGEYDSMLAEKDIVVASVMSEKSELVAQVASLRKQAVELRDQHVQSRSEHAASLAEHSTRSKAERDQIAAESAAHKATVAELKREIDALHVEMDSRGRQHVAELAAQKQAAEKKLEALLGKTREQVTEITKQFAAAHAQSQPVPVSNVGSETRQVDATAPPVKLEKAVKIEGADSDDQQMIEVLAQARNVRRGFDAAQPSSADAAPVPVLPVSAADSASPPSLRPAVLPLEAGRSRDHPHHSVNNEGAAADERLALLRSCRDDSGRVQAGKCMDAFEKHAQGVLEGWSQPTAPFARTNIEVGEVLVSQHGPSQPGARYGTRLLVPQASCDRLPRLMHVCCVCLADIVLDGRCVSRMTDAASCGPLVYVVPVRALSLCSRRWLQATQVCF
jgi:hypothetical protein